VRAVVAARALRAFADGMVSVLLVRHLDDLGFGPTALGAIVAGTLLGSAVATAAVGAVSHRVPVRTLLLVACAVLAATGVGLAAATAFSALLAVAVVGALNPSAGDVTAFLPLEQAHIAGRTEGTARVAAYSIYNLAAAVAGAVGALASALPEEVADALDRSPEVVRRWTFLVYVAVAGVSAVLYRRALPAVPRADRPTTNRRPLAGGTRRTVVGLAALFSLDAAAGGLVVQSLLVAWLDQRFDLSPATIGAVFLGAGLLGAASQLLAGPLAARVGLVRTMVFTHLPANGFLVLAAAAPTAPLAVALLFLRSLVSQVDVPARQALVMAVVPPEDRPAAASATNIPRSLAAATTPLLGGWLLARSGDVGWPLVAAGVGKAAYDLLLWRKASGLEALTR
jgi:MFS family permease